MPVEVVYVRTFALAVKSNTFKVCQNKTFVQMKIKLAANLKKKPFFCCYSEGESSDGIVAYYQSEFDVPVAQQRSLDEAIESLQPPPESGRHGRLLLKPVDALSVNTVISKGLRF